MSDLDLRIALRRALVPAMRAQDRVAARALRGAIAALDNAEAVPLDTLPRAGAVESAAVGVGVADAPRRLLTLGEQRAVIESEVHEREAAAEAYEGFDAGRGTVLRAEAQVLRVYLA